MWQISSCSRQVSSFCDETCPGRNQRLKGGLYRGQNLTSTNQEPPACLAPNSIWQVRAGSQS